MISFLLLTYVLSLAGLIFYTLFIRNRLSLKGQKVALLSLLGGCFIIPIGVMSWQNYQIQQQPQLQQEMFIELCSSYCPSEEQINACYEIALNEEHFCNCVEVKKENLIVYQKNSYFDFFISNRFLFRNVLLISGLLFFFFFLLKLWSLHLLTRKSFKRKINVDGQTFYLLIPPSKIPVSSFRLFNKYIIWDEQLDSLNAEEQKAVIKHELAHINNYDTWLKILENILMVVWFLNPVFYLLKKELYQLSEFIADEFALKHSRDKRFYANLLVKLKKQENLSIAHAFTGGVLKARIKRILDEPVIQRKHAVLWSLSGVVMYAMLTVNILPGLQHEFSKIEIYQDIQEAYSSSGKTVYCKHCLVKDH